MFGIIQPLEIAFRNTIHNRLRSDLGRDDWYDIPGLLKSYEANLVQKARVNIFKTKKPLIADRVVAELTMGFWVTLLDKKYEKDFWNPHIWKCFPHGPKPDRRLMHKRLLKIRDLRNRIAHHEPIFRLNLRVESEKVLNVLKTICPISTCWVRSTHSLPQVD